LLAVTIGLAGGLSAFLINDVVCVALTPLVLHLARRMKFDPIPHLIGLATAANVGSTGTITGNPQNIYGLPQKFCYTKQLTSAVTVAGDFWPWKVAGILLWIYAFVQWKRCEKVCRLRKPQRPLASIEPLCIAG
jgi:Na+/H+ antiporter NhaD/arsenite permease-like protein